MTRLSGCWRLCFICRRPVGRCRPASQKGCFPCRQLRVRLRASGVFPDVPRQAFLPVWRQLVLLVHFLGQTPLLGCIGSVAGDAKL